MKPHVYRTPTVLDKWSATPFVHRRSVGILAGSAGSGPKVHCRAVDGYNIVVTPIGELLTEGRTDDVLAVVSQLVARNNELEPRSRSK